MYVYEELFYILCVLFTLYSHYIFELAYYAVKLYSIDDDYNNIKIYLYTKYTYLKLLIILCR